MSQTVIYRLAGEIVQRELPDPDVRILNDITWGEHCCLFTPAYWVSQVWMSQCHGAENSPYYSQRTLAEEVAFCMLSGFGITAELAGAAFQKCRTLGLIEDLCTDSEAWTEALKAPLPLQGRRVHYRYPNQKAGFLADAMRQLRDGHIDTSSGQRLRNSLLRINGVGPKTAGFITRNVLDSDDVAILDIHVIRAGMLLGLFSQNDKVEHAYGEMEQRYIDFCHAVEVRPSVFDSVVWSQMRTLGVCAINAVKFKLGQPLDQLPRTRQSHQLTLGL